MKKIALAVGAVVVLGFGISLVPPLDQQLATHARAAACSWVVADLERYYNSAVHYNSTARAMGYGNDVMLSIAWTQPPLYVHDAVRQSGSC